MKKPKYLIYNMIAGLMLVIGCINTSFAQTILAGEIPASYNVSNSGAFNYSLPLRIPSGIAGMIPNLAIAYNSQGGTGQLGIGWTIQGLSSISKVPIDIYHNTNIRPVDFYNSQYALDGQRLIATTFPFTSTYYTENKNFAKITQYGTSGNGPSYFIVEYPNGTTYEYGNTTDSKMMGSGRSDVLIWALNKIYDKHGNYITFEYYNDNYSGDYRIRKISYTGNSVISAAPPTEINFNYTAKPDVGMAWIAGSTTTDGYVLSSIEIDQNSSMINKYIFEYHNGSYYGSRLVKIREQRPGNIELPPIDIKWGKEDQINPSPVYSVAYASNNPNGSGDSLLMIGDFNADGMSDYTVRTPSWNSSVDVKMHLNNKSDEFASAQTTNVPNSTWLHVLMNRARNMTVDYNGDGFDDMITYTNDYNSTNNTSTWTVYKSLSNGSTLAAPVQIFQYYYTANKNENAGSMSDDIRILPGDFDGDGKKDLFVIAPRDYSHTSYECFIIGDMYPNGILHHLGSSNGVVMGGEYRYLAYLGHDVQSNIGLDYNGDGRQDILVTSSTSSTELYELNVDYSQPTAAYGIANTGTSMNLLYSGSYPSKDHQLYVGDFNGDGKQDLLTWLSSNQPTHIGNWQLAYSTGAGGNASTAFDYKTAPSDLNPYAGSFPNYFNYFIGDFDGNGKDDILQMDNDQWNPTPLWTICYYSGYNQTTAE
ncbi:MAG TPA: FG-GAP-like repeat-containing protein, partial [Candidatus Babeliaceae bacterium]|nr:FG-GAP-like repeat-containing protein [Candidatus Babeliaceae bacterium]